MARDAIVRPPSSNHKITIACEIDYGQTRTASPSPSLSHSGWEGMIFLPGDRKIHREDPSTGKSNLVRRSLAHCCPPIHPTMCLPQQFLRKEESKVVRNDSAMIEYTMSNKISQSWELKSNQPCTLRETCLVWLSSSARLMMSDSEMKSGLRADSRFLARVAEAFFQPRKCIS